MRQTGRVISTDGKTAVVRFKRSSACGKCNACFTLGSSEADVEIDNLLAAKAGDDVVIELHGSNILKASLLMYGIPLAALILGVFVGNIWGDLWAAGLGLAFAAGTFFIFRALEPKISRMGSFKPRMIEIADDIITNEGGNDNE